MTISFPEILVLLREVVDPKPPVQIARGGSIIRDRGLRRVVNPGDLEALETALRFQDRGEAAVTVAAVGPGRVEDALRLGLAMGAGRAIRVWDEALEGKVAGTEARLYERMIEILRPTVILAGARRSDRGDDPAPVLAAARLGIDYCPAVVELVIEGNTAQALRKTDRGGRERISLGLPCVFMVEDGLQTPRYPDLDAVLRSLEASVETWGLPELCLPPAHIGPGASALRVVHYSFPRPAPMRVPTPDPDLPGPERVLALLSGGIRAREGKLHIGSAESAAEGLFSIFRREGLLPKAGA